MNLDKSNELTLYISRFPIPPYYDGEKAKYLLYHQLPIEIPLITIDNYKGDTTIEIKQITYRLQSEISPEIISQILDLKMYPRIDGQLTEFEYYEVSPLLLNHSIYPLYSPIIISPLSKFEYMVKISRATLTIPNETLIFSIFVRLNGIVKTK